MSEIKTFRDLIVWQKSMAMVTHLYQLTRHFPQEEMYGLTSQLRRSAVSVPSNIAEGFGRNAAGDYKRFLQIALGSLCEVDTQLEIAKNLDILSADAFAQAHENCREIERMLCSLIRKI